MQTSGTDANMSTLISKETAYEIIFRSQIRPLLSILAKH